MKKNILTLFLIVLSLACIIFFFHSKSMVGKYESGRGLYSSQEMRCEKLIDNGAVDFANDKQGFEYWNFCIAKNNIKLFSVMRVWGLFLALIFFIGAFYIRTLNLKLSNRDLVIILISPITIIFLYSVGRMIVALIKSNFNIFDSFDGPDDAYVKMITILQICFVLVGILVKFITRRIRRKQ